MKNVDAHIILYAEDFSEDVWEEYCNICKVNYLDTNAICIGFNYLNVNSLITCGCCGNQIKEEDARFVTFEDEDTYVCLECLKKLGKCEICGGS